MKFSHSKSRASQEKLKIFIIDSMCTLLVVLHLDAPKYPMHATWFHEARGHHRNHETKTTYGQ